MPAPGPPLDTLFFHLRRCAALPYTDGAVSNKPDESPPGFLGELNKRRVLRAVVVYAVVAWGVTEVAATVLPALRLPEWTVTLVVALLALGFPIVAILAWIFDLGPDGVERTPPPDRPGAGRLYILLLVAMTAMLSALLYARFLTDDQTPRAAGGAKTPRVAVLPFTDLSPDGDQAYFTDGFHDELIAQLSRVRGLAVSSRTAVMPYRDVARPLVEIADALHADAIVEGSVRYESGRIRVAATLVDAREDVTLWSDRFDRERSTADIFAIQEEVATRIAVALQGEVGELGNTHAARLPTSSLLAYEQYALGRHHLWRWNYQDLYKAIDFFEAALAADPDFAAAHQGLAWAYAIAGTSYGAMIPSKAYPLARAHGQRAVELEPGLVDAQLVLTDLRSWYDWEFDEAERRLFQLLAEYPDHYGVHLSLAFHLGMMGRHEEALEHIDAALAMTPGDVSVMANAGWRYIAADRCPETLALAEQILAIDDTYDEAYNLRGYCQSMAGDLEAALESLEAGQYAAMRARTLALLGRESEAQAVIDDMLAIRERTGYYPPIQIAQAYLGFGDYDVVFEWLDRAVEARNRNVTLIKTEPVWAPLRDDPRYVELLRRIGLPDD